MKEDLSIDQILSSIRQVILGKKNDQLDVESCLEDNQDDVYELTNLATPKSDYAYLLNSATANHLISKKAAKAASESLKQLAEAKQKQNSQPVKSKSNTIENLVVELIKPYLQTWLDENLPKIVKNLVAKEINRIMSDEKHNIDKPHN
jgi:cell pole-organizing protein PopZ